MRLGGHKLMQQREKFPGSLYHAERQEPLRGQTPSSVMVLNCTNSILQHAFWQRATLSPTCGDGEALQVVRG